MKIICFGSLNLDYVYQVDHIVQPGETTISRDYQLFNGGKGLNQAIAAGRAGAACSMAGIIGQDGVHLLKYLQQSNVDTDLITVSDKKTGHAIIQVDKTGQNSIIYYPGSNQLIGEACINQVLAQCEPGDYILLQNEISNIPSIIEQAKQKRLKIAFNPSPITTDIFEYPIHLVDLLVVNEIEGFELTQEKDAESIIRKLHENYPRTMVLLTLGKNGAVFSNGDNAYRHGVYDVEVVDTTAAGDTFIGYFLTSFSNNESIEDCLRKASVASALAVSRQGASPSIPTLSEVQNSRLTLK